MTGGEIESWRNEIRTGLGLVLLWMGVELESSMATNR